MTVLMFCLGLLFFGFVLFVSIGLHEFGHFSVARFFKIPVPKFFIGFGKTLWSRKIGETNFGLKLIPLGGFVVIEDDTVKAPDAKVLEDLQAKIDDETLTKSERKKHKNELKKINDTYVAEKGLLSNVAPWKRILIYFAGPAVNLILGFLILYTVLMTFDSFVVNNTVKAVNSCSEITAAESCEGEKSGVKVGDKIVAIDGVEVKETEELSPYLAGKDSIELTVVREGSVMNIDTELKNSLIGINLTPEIRPLTFGESTDKMIVVVQQSIESVIKIPEKMPAVAEQIVKGGERDPEAPSSLVHAGKTYGDTSADMELPAKSKIQILLTYSGILNLSLAIVNLIPVLVTLDGGKITIAVVDQFKIWFSRLTKRKYKPVGVLGLTVMSVISLAIIVSFMGLLVVSDVVNIFRGQI